MPIPSAQYNRLPPRSWYSYTDGSGRGDGPIGRPLDKANWCSDSDLPGDPNFPAALLPTDYGGPGWLLAPIETAAIRDLSTIDEILQTRIGRGQGIDIYQNQYWDLYQWADRIANDWYGKDYADLTDYDKRRQIRCAMLGASRKAYLVMYVANAEDIQSLSSDQAAFAGIANLGLGIACAASNNVIICIIAGITAAVSGVIAIASKEQLESISAALTAGEEMSRTQQEIVCDNIALWLEVSDVVWDSARGTLISTVNDPEVTAQLNQINTTISQIREATGQGLETVCEILGGVDLEEIDTSAPLPDGPTYEELVEQSRSRMAYTANDLQCQANAARLGWNYADRARYYENGVPWIPGSVGGYCAVNIKQNRNAVPWAGNGNGNGNGMGGDFFTQKIAGVPLIAWGVVGWALFSGGYLGGRRTGRRRAAANGA